MNSPLTSSKLQLLGREVSVWLDRVRNLRTNWSCRFLLSLFFAFWSLASERPLSRVIPSSDASRLGLRAFSAWLPMFLVFERGRFLVLCSEPRAGFKDGKTILHGQKLCEFNPGRWESGSAFALQSTAFSLANVSGAWMGVCLEGSGLQWNWSEVNSQALSSHGHGRDSLGAVADGPRMSGSGPVSSLSLDHLCPPSSFPTLAPVIRALTWETSSHRQLCSTFIFAKLVAPPRHSKITMII